MIRLCLARGTIFVLFLMFMPSLSHAAIVIDFTGRTFDQVEGADFVLGSDRITGRFLFDAIGDTQAKSITLSASLSGVNLVSFEIPDVNANPLDTGITVSTNSFGAWNAGVPTQWDVTVFGNIFGGANEEQISIHSLLGDLAAVDLGAPAGSTAITLLPGSVTAVPEPSTAIVLGALLPFFSYRRRQFLKSAKLQVPAAVSQS